METKPTLTELEAAEREAWLQYQAKTDEAKPFAAKWNELYTAVKTEAMRQQILAEQAKEKEKI